MTSTLFEAFGLEKWPRHEQTRANQPQGDSAASKPERALGSGS
ncbi:hypothetical protein C7S15_8885 (plasmid) [Burkholderia cepacia]|nr:hypothetical protein [Burkholderia cepacia]